MASETEKAYRVYLQAIRAMVAELQMDFEEKLVWNRDRVGTEGNAVVINVYRKVPCGPFGLLRCGDNIARILPEDSRHLNYIDDPNIDLAMERFFENVRLRYPNRRFGWE